MAACSLLELSIGKLIISIWARNPQAMGDGLNKKSLKSSPETVSDLSLSLLFSAGIDCSLVLSSSNAVLTNENKEELTPPFWGISSERSKEEKLSGQASASNDLCIYVTATSGERCLGSGMYCSSGSFGSGTKADGCSSSTGCASGITDGEVDRLWDFSALVSVFLSSGFSVVLRLLRLETILLPLLLESRELEVAKGKGGYDDKEVV